jgi:hypothetical protein
VIHDTSGGSEDDVSELTRWQELNNPFLEVTELNVVAGADDTGFVDATIQLDRGLRKESAHVLPSVELDDNFAVAVVINFLELANVA